MSRGPVQPKFRHHRPAPFVDRPDSPSPLLPAHYPSYQRQWPVRGSPSPPCAAVRTAASPDVARPRGHPRALSEHETSFAILSPVPGRRLPPRAGTRYESPYLSTVEWFGAVRRSCVGSGGALSRDPRQRNTIRRHLGASGDLPGHRSACRRPPDAALGPEARRRRRLAGGCPACRLRGARPGELARGAPWFDDG
jgi:hypothetical protein